MIASNKQHTKLTILVDIARLIVGWGDSQGSALVLKQETTSTPQRPSFTQCKSRIFATPNLKVPQPKSSSLQFETQKMSSTSYFTKVPYDLKLGHKVEKLETKSMYEKFWSELKKCFFLKVKTKYSISKDQIERASIDETNWII
jgi:hypothetical protein